MWVYTRGLLQAPKSCLSLIRSHPGEARKSKTLSNSATKPKKPFPTPPGLGFFWVAPSDAGQPRHKGNPHPLPSLGSPHTTLENGVTIFFRALSLHPGVLAGSA